MTFDLTLSRQIHTVGGIIVWILTRIALLTGSALNSMAFGSSLYYFILWEIILAFILFLTAEIIYRVKRKYWVYPKAFIPTKEGDYTKLLEMIRSKGRLII